MEKGGYKRSDGVVHKFLSGRGYDMVQRSWLQKMGVCISSLMFIAVLGVGCTYNQQLKEVNASKAAAEAAMKAAQAAAAKAEQAAGRAALEADRAEAAASKAQDAADRACACADKCERAFQKTMRK